MRRILLNIPGIIITFCMLYFLTLIYALVVTHGTLDLSMPELLSSIYTNMLDHFKAGDFEVDLRTVRNEAFYSQGRVTTYQGPFLAFLRAFIELFFSRNGRDWARLSCLVASVLTTLFLSMCTFEVSWSRFRSRFALLLGISLIASFAFGSPVIFLLSNAYIYNEPILWGMAWSSIYFWTFLRLLRSNTLWSFTVLLSLMALSAGFALLSRASFGGALILSHGLIILVLQTQGEKVYSILSLPPKKNLPILETLSGRMKIFAISLSLLPLVVLIALTLFINHGRWGNALTFMPTLQNINYLENNKIDLNPRGTRLLRNGTLNFRRFPFAMEYYFFPDVSVFTKRFPFLRFKSSDFMFKGSAGTYDYIEGTRIPFSLNSPFVFLYGVMGYILFFCYSWKPCLKSLDTALLLGPLTQVLFMTTLSSVALRYQLDLLPFFAIGCLFFVAFQGEYQNFVSTQYKRVFSLGTVILAVFGIYAATSTMMMAKMWSRATPMETCEQLFALLKLPQDDVLRNPGLLYNQTNLLGEK